MSRLVKTRGIVIRHSPTSETSRVVHWLTEESGRISTIAKGAMRPRNDFLGQIDQFYTCELVYYARDRDALYITREVSPIHVRSRFRADWRATLAAHYCTDLTSRITPHNEPIAALYGLLDDALNELDTRGWHPPMLHLFELRILDHLGLTPRLTHCAVCDKRFQPGDHTMFSSRHGGMMCRLCSPTESNTLTVGPDVAAILNHWQTSHGWHAARSARCTEKQLQSIRLLLGDFLTYHLELFPGARESVLDMLFADNMLRHGRKISL